MIKDFIGFSKFKSKEEFDEFIKKAHDDNHGLFFPTHPLRKNGELVGYFSVGSPGAMICFAWLSTKEVTARESFHLINDVESLVSANPEFKDPVICFPVPKDSPFHGIMEHMGYQNAGEYSFFIKKV